MTKKGDRVCLNLGSGPKSAENWINYDWGLLPLFGILGINSVLAGWGIFEPEYSVRWDKIKLHNLKRGLSERDRSVNYIYCSHVLEHLEKDECRKVLLECRRVLKENGVLRVVLPDLNLLKKIEDADEFNRKFFGYDKDIYTGWGNKLKKMFIRPHLWMYNYESLRRLLDSVGFEKINKKTFRTGSLPDLKTLDLEVHKKLSFYVEAER